MTTDELKRHKLFGLCTAREQQFLLAYCRTGGDIETAVRDAYGCFTDRAVWSKARQLQDCTIVRQLLMVLDGQYQPSRAELIQLAWQNAQTFTSESNRQAALELATELCGYRDGGADPPDQRQLADRLKTLSE